MRKEGAVVVVMNEANEILLLLRPNEAHWAPCKWGFPGGKIEPGEAPINAAIRETKEETQLDVFDLQPFNAVGDRKFEEASLWSYYTRNFDGDVEIDYEHDDWEWVAEKDIGNYQLAPGVLEMYEWVLNNGG